MCVRHGPVHHIKGFSLPSLVCDPTLPATVVKSQGGREKKRMERTGGGSGGVRRWVGGVVEGGVCGGGEKKMEERWEESTERGWGERKRERERQGGAQFAITGAAGQKVSKKEDERVCVHVSLCVCVCVSNKGEKTTHLNVRYREAWCAGREGWVEEGWEEWIWITGMKILLFSAVSLISLWQCYRPVCVCVCVCVRVCVYVCMYVCVCVSSSFSKFVRSLHFTLSAPLTSTHDVQTTDTVKIDDITVSQKWRQNILMETCLLHVIRWEIKMYQLFCRMIGSD